MTKTKAALAAFLFALFATTAHGQVTLTRQPQNQTVSSGSTATFTATASESCRTVWYRNASVLVYGTIAATVSYTTPATKVTDSGAKFSVLFYGCPDGSKVRSPAATLTVNPATAPPSITTEPANQTVSSGQSTSFTAAATGTPPLSYQWFENGTAIGGATLSTYTTPATTTSDSGSTFAVVVSNSAGSVTSAAATLTVTAAPVAPNLTTQPANQEVTAGQAATFTAAATGTAPLSYQWEENGATISGATSASYTTPATTTSDSGEVFQVSISNSAGSVTSNSATLTVTPVTVATATVDSTMPGLAIPSNFGGISTFSVSDDCDLMGTAAAPNPIYRQLIKNLVFPGQGFLLTSEDEDGNGGGAVSGGPSATQVGCLAQLWSDLQNAGVTGYQYAHGTPLCAGNQTLANQYAAAFLTNMPAGWAASPLAVVGNEPDGPCGISYSTYLSRFQTWTSAMKALSGGSGYSFLGPQFGGQQPWTDTSSDLNSFVNSQTTPAPLSFAGQHWYSLVGCGSTPTPAQLLAPSAAKPADANYPNYISNAHGAGTKLRISEMNSVDCGGTDGVSNVFASTLWVMDALFNLASVGTDGVNIFSDEGDNYDLFSFYPYPVPTGNLYPLSCTFNTGGSCQIRPEYYGFMVFQQATQNGAKLLPVTLTTSNNISLWATLDASNTVRVLVINKDQSATGNVNVTLNGYSNGTLSSLSARSVSSTTGVTWAGQTFDGSPDGTIQGALSTATVVPSSNVYTFSMTPASAALLTVSPP